MPRRTWLLVACIVAAAGCSAGTPTNPPTIAPAPTQVPVGTTLVPGGFDFDRVRQMDPAELPDGVPVPIPAGGTIDDSAGVFEGEVLVVEYDPRFFATAAAFYAEWIRREGHVASELVAFGGDATGWEIQVDGQPVRVELQSAAEPPATTLTVLWD